MFLQKTNLDDQSKWGNITRWKSLPPIQHEEYDSFTAFPANNQTLLLSF